jgi:predicted DNA binding CopG/RHH family protein
MQNSEFEKNRSISRLLRRHIDIHIAHQYVTAMVDRTTVRLPEHLLRRARRQAVAEGRSLTSLIEEGLRRVLNERTPAGRGDRILPPVSTAMGGLLPGIDLDDSAALQEVDDLDSAGRLK